VEKGSFQEIGKKGIEKNLIGGEWNFHCENHDNYAKVLWMVT